MKILPTMLLVEDLKEDEITKSGIIIPTTHKIEQMKGEVRFAGKGTSDTEMIYEIGDTVVYKPNSGREVEIDDKKLRLMDIREILFAL